MPGARPTIGTLDMTAQVFRNSRRDTLMSSSVSVTADTALSGAHRQAGAPVAAFHPREWISCAKTVVPRPDLCQVLVGLDQAAHRVWHITCTIDVPVEPSILASEAGAASEAGVARRPRGIVVGGEIGSPGPPRGGGRAPGPDRG